jgi:hypothetical protein
LSEIDRLDRVVLDRDLIRLPGAIVRDGDHVLVHVRLSSSLLARRLQSPVLSFRSKLLSSGEVTGGGVVILGELVRQVINASARKPWTADGSPDFRWDRQACRRAGDW